MRVTLGGAPPGAFAWLLVGSNTAAPPPIGQGSADDWFASRCKLLVSPTIILSRTAGSTGWSAGYTFVSAPYVVGTAGLGIAAQWLCLTPATLDFAMSPRHDLRIQ